MEKPHESQIAINLSLLLQKNPYCFLDDINFVMQRPKSDHLKMLRRAWDPWRMKTSAVISEMSFWRINCQLASLSHLLIRDKAANRQYKNNP